MLFGALDRLGGFFVLACIREFAPFVDAIVLAGVAGTAITADLGARKIREELDALQVLGVDPVKNLVVPRFLALMLVTGLFDIYALLFGIFGGIVATLVNGAPLGPFWATFFTNASTTDLWGSVLKTTLFGAIIAIVCCYKGMTASGGAEGVGRAVNQAVVIALPRRVRVQLRVHPDAAGDPSRDPGDPLDGLALRVPRDWLAAFGEIVASSAGASCGDVYGRASSASSARRCARRGSSSSARRSSSGAWCSSSACSAASRAPTQTQPTGTPAYAGVFAAWCDLRELVPYGFGYMMAAKVGTGHRGRAGLDAHLRRDRRPGGHGHRLDALPRRDAPARRLDGAALHLHRRPSAPASSPATSPSSSRSARSHRRLLPDLLDVPEPTRPACTA